MPPPLHQPLHLALEQEGAALGASEVHGLLCGLICARGAADPRDYLSMIMDDPAQLSETLQNDLDSLAAGSRHALQGDDFEFDLLLPGDDDPLSERFEAVVSWCQGFTLALLLDDPECAALSADAREAMNDLIEISTSDPVVDEDQGPAERDLSEIIEYVRVAVQLIHDVLLQHRPEGDT
ncbi:MAG: UPF0149 family protein [Acidiferrobacteraceae bacterium]